MNNNSIQQMPTPEIITEMAQLEQQIDLFILRYEQLRQEITTRFPQLLQEPAFSEDKYNIKTL